MKKDYETLLKLKKNTLLGLISLLRISIEKEKAERIQLAVNKLSHSTFSIDYSKADNLEFELRFKAWKEKNGALYLKYGTTQNLDDFSLDLLKNANFIKVK